MVHYTKIFLFRFSSSAAVVRFFQMDFVQRIGVSESFSTGKDLHIDSFIFSFNGMEVFLWVFGFGFFCFF